MLPLPSVVSTKRVKIVSFGNRLIISYLIRSCFDGFRRGLMLTCWRVHSSHNRIIIEFKWRKYPPVKVNRYNTSHSNNTSRLHTIYVQIWCKVKSFGAAINGYHNINVRVVYILLHHKHTRLLSPHGLISPEQYRELGVSLIFMNCCIEPSESRM